jgi:hypothetical protein
MNNTNLINRSAVKKQALQYASTSNKAQLTRVSAEFVERANAALDSWIKTELENHPLDGKTIK